MKFHLLLFFALFALFQVTLGSGECGQQLSLIKVKLDSMSHYEGTGEMPTDMGTMDDDPDRKRDANPDPSDPADCFMLNANSTAVDVNCNSHKCITLILNVVDEYDSIMDAGICTPAELKGEEEEKVVHQIELLRELSQCNQCIVHYTKFQKLEAQMKAVSCYPSATHYKCDEDCSSMLEAYSHLWEKMIGQGVCRMYNPGGCGDMGGVTEGDIYNLLNDMFSEISRVNTVFSLCSAGCEKPMVAWYQEWKPLVAKGCISTSDADLTTNTTFLQIFTLDQQCTGECRTGVSEVVSSYHKNTPAKCHVGLIDIHFSELTNSVNFDRCKDDVDASLSVEIIAKAFFTLSLLSVGVFFIYFFSSMAYNCFVKGKRGWEAVPTIFFCCCFKSSGSPSSTKKKAPRDEEEVVLYDADDFDDDGL